MAQMGPECKLCKEMYIFLGTTMAHKGDFGDQKGSSGPMGPRPYLRFPRQEAIFSWKYVAFFEWNRKQAKTLLEVALDLMEWPKWVQNANYVKTCTIF